MSPDQPIRIALIGYGLSGQTFHAPLIQSVEGLHLDVVMSRRPEEVHKNLPSVAVESTFDATLARDIDLVIVATPNELHTSMAKAALEAGKHVVVDKPFTTTIAEAALLTKLASDKQRIISVFQNRRWDSDFLAAKEILASGKLGEVVHFESHMDRYRPALRPSWKDQNLPASGVWYDLGPHLVDQALQLFGEPKGIHGHFAWQRPHAQNRDWAHVILDYGPLRVVLHASTVAAIPAPRFTIHGLKGSWTKQLWDPQENQLKSGMTAGVEPYGDDPDLAVFHEGETGKSTQIKCPLGDYRQYYVALRDAIWGRGDNPVRPAQALRVMAILEQAVLTGR